MEISSYLGNLINVASLHPLLSFLFVLRSPTCQRWPPMHHITHTPEHPLLICCFRDIVVWADDIELVLLHLRKHVLCHLRRFPSAVRLLGQGTGGVTALHFCLEKFEENSRFAQLTRPVKVHPGTSRCTLVLESRRSKLRCSARDLIAALEELYAAFPGGLVMPCLDPVMTIADGIEDFLAWNAGTKVLRPFTTPKRFVSKICDN